MVKFHIIALKCGECGSYNTSRDDDGNAPVNPAVAAAVVAQNVLELEVQEGEDNDEDGEGEIGDDDGSESTSDDMTDNGDDDASVRSDLSLD
jgi:transcription elongation factor Elf1